MSRGEPNRTLIQPAVVADLEVERQAFGFQAECVARRYPGAFGKQVMSQTMARINISQGFNRYFMRFPINKIVIRKSLFLGSNAQCQCQLTELLAATIPQQFRPEAVARQS